MERKKRSLKQSTRHAQKKELRKIMEKLENAVVLVEGKKDEQALRPYIGNGRIFQVSSGRLRGACEKIAKTGASEALVLTDMDDAGEELAKLAEAELRGHGIRAGLEVRRRLMGLLMLRYVENFGKKYEKKLEELEESQAAKNRN